MFKSHLISLSYFIAALVFGVLALMEQSEDLDLVFPEIYFVLPKSLLWVILACTFILFAGISLTFELFKKPMNKYLFGIHFLMTILGLTVIYFAVQQNAPPNVHTDYSIMDDVRERSEDPINWLAWVSTTSYALIGAQILFGVNMVLSILWTKKKI